MIELTVLAKQQARERRNRLFDTAAAAQLSLTEGVREMRAISGMTEEEFACHRSVSVEELKAVELGQGNPTVATLNQIANFFGLEVAFIPMTPIVKDESSSEPVTATELSAMLERFAVQIGRQFNEALAGVSIAPHSIPGTASQGAVTTKNSSSLHILRDDASRS